MNEILLSVIIPVYNTADYLEECVESVLRQKIQDAIEIILVDDGSTDSAGIICDTYESSYENITTIHKKNEGLGLARNSGMEVAKGKYIAFLDSDDYVEADFYEGLVLECEKTNSDICFAGGVIHNVNGKLKKILYNKVEKALITEKSDLNSFIPRLISNRPDTSDNVPATAWNSVYRKDFLTINKIKFISERIFISEDVWFNMDCLYSAESVAYCNVVGYVYRYNGNSLSRGYNPRRFGLLISSINLLDEKCKSMKLEDYKLRIALYYWVNFEKCINQEIRYEGKNTREQINSIRGMVENKISFALLSLLLTAPNFKGMQGFLCRLAVKKHFLIIVYLLRLYNGVKHRND